jgi:hypothetical protein
MISAIDKFMKTATTTYMIERNCRRNLSGKNWRWPIEQEKIQIDVANQMVERWESLSYIGANSNTTCLDNLDRDRNSSNGRHLRQGIFTEVMATLTELEVALKEEDEKESQLQRQLQKQFGIRNEANSFSDFEL